MVIGGVEEVAEGPKEEDRNMQVRVYREHDLLYMEILKATKYICSDAPTRVWDGWGIGKHLVVFTPLLDSSTSNRAHHAQLEAEKHHDIDANGAT
jgi:hypothetical protein